ncbi:MAG TPA: pentapeptide repeat-containing protein [Pirellulales bacterium]|nr:pentapeptide repeat-containing protein [Pirellulales bacterium]
MSCPVSAERRSDANRLQRLCTGATFEGATVGHVVFRDCNLANARFIRSRLSEVDVRGSRIDGIEINLENLPGLRIDLSQSPAIAALTGVVIELG